MAINSIFSYDNVLPGVFTEIDSKLTGDYDTSLFGTTDSIVVIGTAFDGPVGVPSPVYSVDHANYLFGKNYDAKTRKEASLVTGIEDAWNRGCRTIYGMRINGKDCVKDFDFCANLNYKLRIKSRYPSNLAKQCYFKYDNTDGLETITIYKPAARATIAEKMNGLVESADCIMANEIRLAEDYGFTKATRLSEVINLVEDTDVTNNNVLEFQIIDENGKVVTNDNDAAVVTLGHLFPGVYFIGRESSSIEKVTDVTIKLVVDKTDQVPYDGFEGKYFKVLNMNTDVTNNMPIHYSSLKDMRALLEKVGITMDEADDYLKVAEETNKAFPEDKIDYEEKSLTNFEIYKKLGSGYAVTAVAERRTDKKGNELVPRVKEASLTDSARIQYLGDEGIYGILQDTKIRYHVLANDINADAVISGKLPKAAEFKTTVANDVEILGGLVNVKAKVEKDDTYKPRKFAFTVSEHPKDIISKADVAEESAKIIGSDTETNILAATNVPEGEIVISTTEAGIVSSTSVLYVANDKGIFVASADSKYNGLYLTAKELVRVDLSLESNQIIKATDVSKKYIVAETNSDVFLVKVGAGLDSSLFLCDVNEALTTDEEEFGLFTIYQDSSVGTNKVMISYPKLEELTLQDFVEMLNESELAKKFVFSLTQEGRINKEEYVSDIAKDYLNKEEVLEADRTRGYDYTMHIPYMTTDNFARQLAQHCTYTELKTYPTHGVIGCKTVSDLSKTHLAEKLASVREFSWDMYAKNQQGRHMLDANNQPYNIGRSVSVTLFQNQFTTNTNYTAIVNGATSYAAFVSQLDVGQSSTGQPIGLTPMYEFSRTQLEILSALGLVTLRNSFTQGYVVTDGVTMAPNSDLLRRLFNTRVMHFCEDLIRAACDPFLGKTNNEVNRNSLSTAITSNLNRVLDQLIRRFEFKISDDGTAEQFTYIDIDYTIVPMNEIREIRNYIKVQQN